MLTAMVTVGSCQPETYIVGVEVGDWVKYSVSRTGPRRGWGISPNTEWIKVEVQNISGTNVTIRESETTGTIRMISGDIAGGSVDRYIIAGNLSAGDEIFFGLWKLFINRTVSKSYGGVSKEANLVEWSVVKLDFGYMANCSQEYCWDKETGFLLEMTWTAYYLGYENTSKSTLSMKIAETSMWEMAQTSIQWWPWVAVGAVLVVAGVASVTIRNRQNRKNDKDKKLCPS